MTPVEQEAIFDRINALEKKVDELMKRGITLPACPLPHYPAQPPYQPQPSPNQYPPYPWPYPNVFYYTS